MRLLPREEKFFSLFLDQVKLISEAADVLLSAAESGNARLAEAAEKIILLERKGDEITHEVFIRLNQTFITPLDPEDIHAIASRLDDVMDGIEDAVHRIVAYRLECIPPPVVELCVIVRDSTRVLARALTALSEQRPLLEDCIEVNRLEEMADSILRTAVAALFEKETNPITLIKLKEVYEFLEATTDRCEDVADILQQVVVKNS